MVNEAVAVTGLTVRRGRRTALHDVSLTLPAGGVTGLLGPSGSGKSTLLRSLMGIQRGVSGTVEVLGEPAGSPRLRPRIGYMMQSSGVFTDLTVADNIRYFAGLLRLPRADVERVIDLCDLHSVRNSPVSAVSGGQANRTSLAVALLGGPDLLVLDEPTVGLDPVLRAELWSLFRRLAASGTTLLVSSHVMDEATRCDRLVLLRDGRVLTSTTPARLLSTTGEADPESAFLAMIRSQGDPP